MGIGSMLEGIADLEVVLRGEIEGVSILHERRRGQQKPWSVVEYEEQWQLEDVDEEVWVGKCTREGLNAAVKEKDGAIEWSNGRVGGERVDSLVTFHEG
jgi:hypothetical protein